MDKTFSKWWGKMHPRFCLHTCVLSCFRLCDLMDCSPLVMEFSSKNTGVDCHFLLQGIVLKPTFPASPALAGGFFVAEPPGKPRFWLLYYISKDFAFCQHFENEINQLEINKEHKDWEHLPLFFVCEESEMNINSSIVYSNFKSNWKNYVIINSAKQILYDKENIGILLLNTK